MSVTGLALQRPYTVIAVLLLISLLGLGAASRMPVDIFPEIDIPVVSAVWPYSANVVIGRDDGDRIELASGLGPGESSGLTITRRS